MISVNKDWLPDIFEAAYRASDAMLEIYNKDFTVYHKKDESPVTEADLESNRIMSEALEKTGVIIVSEEADFPSFESRKDKDVWLLDPLDGTKNFIQKLDEFCICVALIQDHQPTFGIIASPIERKILFGGGNLRAAIIDYGEKDIFNEKFQLPNIQNKMINNVIYSRTHYTPRIDKIVEKIRAEHGICGRILKGSALKFFDLATDRAQVYPRLWPTMEWDIAPGHAIYNTIGGEIVDFTTFTPLRYNKQDLENPMFIAKPKGLKIL